MTAVTSAVLSRSESKSIDFHADSILKNQQGTSRFLSLHFYCED